MPDLERFVKRLLETLRARHPAGAQRPFTVAELRDAILPYRMHRSALKLSSNEDYELLVLRLTAEEGGYARTTPPDAAERAREEVASPVPDLDLLDLLGDTTLQLAPGLTDRLAAAESAEQAQTAAREAPVTGLVAPVDFVRSAAEDEVPVEPAADAERAEPASADSSDPAGDEEDAESDTLELSLEGPVAPEATAAAPVAGVRPPPEPFEPLADSVSVDGVTATSSGEQVCTSCETSLPTDRPLAFCPFCGERVGVRRCRRCGSEMEPEWRYCGACGEAHVR